MAHDAVRGIRRRARAEGVDRASREAANRGETHAKGRADGPPLLQIILVGNGSCCR